MTITSNTANPARSAKEQFDRQAAHYDGQWNSWSEETLAWMLAHADCRPTDRALDVATGAGYTAIAFAPRVGSVDALDVSSGMLDQARSRAAELGIDNIAFHEAPAEDLPFPDSTFDLVLCRIAAHHFLDVHRFASEAARVLVPGGRFVLTDTTVPDNDLDAAAWQNEVEALRDPSHVQNYSPEQWRALLMQVGFSVDELTTAGSGITLPLDDWLFKAGATDTQSENVRRRFAEAPQSARNAYNIQDTDGESNTPSVSFTWMRVAVKAVKG